MKTCSKSYDIANTRGSVFTIDLSGIPAGIAVTPGSKQTVETSISNKGTENMYVFIRFDIGTVNGKSIYSFTVSDVSGWAEVKDLGDPSKILLVYGESSTSVALEPGNDATLSGTLKCIASGSDFPSLSDNDFKVKLVGCAIGSEGENGTAKKIYDDYKNVSSQDSRSLAKS